MEMTEFDRPDTVLCCFTRKIQQRNLWLFVTPIAELPGCIPVIPCFA
jgi:hypothetical protein